MCDILFPILLLYFQHYQLFLKVIYPIFYIFTNYTKNSFNIAHNGLTITLKNPISFFAIIPDLSKSFINGVYVIFFSPSSSYYALNSIFTFSVQVLDKSNCLAAPLKSDV